MGPVRLRGVIEWYEEIVAVDGMRLPRAMARSFRSGPVGLTRGRFEDYPIEHVDGLLQTLTR